MKNFFIAFLLVLFFASPACVFASPKTSEGLDSFALTITPPVIKINMKPGESIASEIKVINNNNREVKFYATIANFKNASDGQVEFDDFASEEERAFTLKQWMTLTQESFVVPAFKDAKVPFIINVPENASPGGHYAGILVGTTPPDSTNEGAVVKVSSYISSLLLVNIAGDVVEKGYIRQFNTDKKWYGYKENEKVEFNVRFENLGNVHLRPVGDVRIYDFFGKEKGVMEINNKTNLGNVLPESSRNWSLSWDVNKDFFLINRYKGVLNISFGEEAKQSDAQEVFFWIFDIKMLLIIVGSVLVFFVILILFIKFFIGQSLNRVKKQIERERLEIEKKLQIRKLPTNQIKKPQKKVVDLRKK